MGEGGESKPPPSTPEVAYHPPRVTIHDDGESVPNTPENAKVVDYEKLRGKKRIHEENGRYYFYDSIGRKYECDEEGNKMWTSRRRPPQYDAYVWKQLGDDGRKGILDHFHNSPEKNCMVTSEGTIVDEIQTSDAIVDAEGQERYQSYKNREFRHFNSNISPCKFRGNMC